MRKGIMIILISMIGMMLWGERQSFSSIEKVATNFIQNKLGRVNVQENYEVKNGEEVYAYIFNLEPEGFVAVSNDSRIPPVIAYSIRNRLLEADKNENLYYEMIAEDLAKRLEYYRLHEEEAEINKALWQSMLQNNFSTRDFQQWPPRGLTITDGWVETSWNQSGVFNQFCPLDNSNQRSVVGCVATAMAMIADYHEYIGDVSFSNADDYTSGYNYPYIYIDNDYIEHDFPNFPQLNVYLDDLKSRYLNNETLTGTDKAALSFACGIATEMSYSSSGSGTWTAYVESALLNKFDYDTAEYIENYGSSFYNTLKENMKTMKPAEMSIYTAGWNDGHAIICDGYNTDDFYHLNYGWGTSNATCWYSLPYGMPSNYSIIGGAVVNIEGGASPIGVQGQVIASGISPVGTFIRLEGDHISEVYVTNTSGTFSIPAIWPGFYTVTAFLEDRFHYQTFEVEITNNNQFIQIQLDEFDQVTGNISAPVSAENCMIHFYKDEEIVYSGMANQDGTYSIPEVFPGIYTATASLADHYFQMKEIEITAENQIVNFDLEEFPGTISYSYASYPAGIFSFIPNYEITFAMKFTEEEWSDLSGDILAKVRFISPISPDEGELYAQLWQGDSLIHEKPIQAFMPGEWIECQFDSFLPQVGGPYYIGYKIISQTGEFAYYDNTPKVAGKSSFMRFTAWSEISDVLLENNLCLEAEFFTQTFGTAQGNVTFNVANVEMADVAIKAGNYITHPDETGFFSFSLKPGTYEINAYYDGYESAEPQTVTIEENEIVEDITIELFPTDSQENNIPHAGEIVLSNYPNPFNPSTMIQFTLPQENFVELSIFNVKGQKVKILSHDIKPAGNHEIEWNGTDESGNSVSSGIYLYQLKTNQKTVTQKMLLAK